MFSLLSGSVEALLANLSSANEEVRSSAAVALGYLSFDRTASRLMLQACRNTPGLLESLVCNLGNGEISMEFMDEWRQTKLVGLPSARLVTCFLFNCVLMLLWTDKTWGEDETRNSRR